MSTKEEQPQPAAKQPTKPKTSPFLLLSTMAMEGVVFGVLYGWGLWGTSAAAPTGLTGAPGTQRLLNLASLFGPLLLLDQASGTGAAAKYSQLDYAVVIAHFVLSVQRGMDAKLVSHAGAFSPAQSGFNNSLLPILAAVVHARAFLFLLITQRCLVKRLVMIALFHLGAKLPFT